MPENISEAAFYKMVDELIRRLVANRTDHLKPRIAALEARANAARARSSTNFQGMVLDYAATKAELSGITREYMAIRAELDQVQGDFEAAIAAEVGDDGLLDSQALIRALEAFGRIRSYTDDEHLALIERLIGWVTATTLDMGSAARS